MLVIRKKDMEKYGDFMDKVSVSMLTHSCESLVELGLDKTPEQLLDNTEAIGKAVGQVVLDDVIEFTKDYTREELVRFLAHNSAQLSMKVMNSDPMYRMKITLLSKLK